MKFQYISLNKYFLVLIFSTLYLTTIAQKPRYEWSPEDIINTKSVSSLSYSTDNTMMVWTQRKGVKKKDKFVSDIYLTRLDVIKDGKPKTIQLTNGNDSDYSPIFSKDGETIYFLSSRTKGKKLWSLSIYGGEAVAVNEFDNGISNIQWLNKDELAFVSNEGKSLYDLNAEKIKDNVQVVEDSLHWKISKLYAFNIKEKTIRKLTNNSFPINDYSVSKDGKHVITSHRMSPHYGIDASPKNTYFLQETNSRKRTEILKGLQTPYGFTFTPDLKGFYFIADNSSDPEWTGSGISELYYYTLASNAYVKIDLKWGNGVASGYSLLGNNVLVSLANNATRTLGYYIKNTAGWTKKKVDLGAMNEHIRILNVSKDGSKVAFKHSTASMLPRYYVGDISYKKGVLGFNSQKEFIVLNKNLNKKNIAKSKVYQWKGANDDSVDGILYYPKDYVAGKKYPLILSIHGGPSSTDTDSWSERWSTYPQLLTERGAFVLKPNYHGSSNHGKAFVESIKGHYYDLELVDIINGINSLDAKGMINMDMLGTMGWSNGAILTTMLTVRYPDMFKVAAAGAGDVNWTSDYGTCGFGVQFDQSYFGGAPWDDVDGKNYNEKYILKSPLFDIEKVKTPTIIFHGSEDRAVPRDQGWEYYRGLQQVGKAPVKFLWFPGQPHGLRKITHQLRKMKEELAWIDKYLFGVESDENEAFKEDSPLAELIKRQGAKSNNGLLGDMINDLLIPEMQSLKKDSIAISKFELTNAQYQSFDNNHSFEYGKANHPIYNLSKANMTAYISWINTSTDNIYRLPNKKEGEALQKEAIKVAQKENTLNYWAGYELTAADAIILQDKIKDLKHNLIEAVGKYKPVKIEKATLYDLGGNVAEYYLDNGAYKIYGYSAYDLADPSSQGTNQQSKYVGLRLIRKAKAQ